MKRLFCATLQHRGPRLLLWYLIAATSLMLSYVAGPFIQFAFAFVLPVALAARFDGLRHALAFGIALPAINLGFVLGLWSVPWTDGHSIANAAIRVCVLSLLAFLTAVASRHRTLRREVAVLEKILPMCSICKRIRDRDESWQPLEAYFSAHTDIALSHGLCPDCARTHYGEYAQDH